MHLYRWHILKYGCYLLLAMLLFHLQTESRKKSSKLLPVAFSLSVHGLKLPLHARQIIFCCFPLSAAAAILDKQYDSTGCQCCCANAKNS